MTTLFSPVGTADPVTQLGDGPLLHIIRHRRPDKVVLFLSPAMAGFQQQDKRYTRAIELLAESVGVPAPEVRLIESSFEEVYRFDRYIEEFEPILKDLSGEGDVLVNTSSGTAGMSQALVALGSFGRLNLELLQVLTPKRGINSSNDRENPNKYDLDLLWELNQDNNSGAGCRIVSVATPNFSERLLRGNVITLVQGYEYEAAYKLACQMSTASDAAKQMIQATACRLNLDGGLPAKVFGGTEVSYKANDLLLEYLYVMEVRLAQGHWADFVRSLTPALTELMKRRLSEYLSEERYTLFANGRSTNRYNVEAIDGDFRLSSVLSLCHYDNRNAFITNDAYGRLVQEYCEDQRVKDAILQLRNAEKNCRNSIAHTLAASSRAALERLCSMTLDDIMRTLFELHGQAKPGLYDRINQRIIDSI